MRFGDYKRIARELESSPMEAFLRENNIVAMEALHGRLVDEVELAIFIKPPFLEFHHSCPVCLLEETLDVLDRETALNFIQAALSQG